MLFPSMFVLVYVFCLLDRTVPGDSLEVRNGAYEDLVVSISDSVPTTDCQAILSNLETTLTSASGYLFSALDGRAYLHGTSILLPETWPDSCLPRGQRPVPHTGDTADITILPTVNDPRGRLWTQQSAGCGQPGDGIFLGWEGLVKRDDTLARSLVKEFAMYRYGVFEEQGYINDPIHPMCYYDDQNKKSVITGCSDEPINDLGMCDPSSGISAATYNATRMVSPQARSSILFAAEAPHVSMFCDKFTHDRYAPTKHNLLCARQSTLDVIVRHEDFKGAKGGQAGESELGGSSEIRNTQPRVKYVRQTVTRYILVIENTSDMLRRESWQFLRVAIRKWVYDLPANAEVALVMTNDTGSLKLLKLRSMTNSNNRDSVASEIPYSPSDSSMQPCLHCAMREALDMLAEKARVEGAGTGVIVTIATGMNYNSNIQSIVKDCKKAKVKIATINYPAIVRSDLLDMLATETGGISFTVLEKKANVQSTLLSTYFQLTNVLYNIMEKFYAGNKNDLPMEIHRREIRDDGRSSITGSFVLDENMAEPAKFILYTYNINAPLIKSVKLTSPSLKEYTTRSDNMLMFKMITLSINLTETGTWTYTVEPFIGNPQPHFLQVMASPVSPTVPIITARFWTHQNEPRAPIILFAEVKYGDYPILGAKVEAIIRKAESNGSVIFSERLELLDSGSGDPDITKADGVYSRYFSAMNGGAGVYTFEVTVSDNGNTAYTWVKDGNTDEDVGTPCCGSKVPSHNVAPISPFQRVLPTKTISFTPDDINKANEFSVGRIGDLRVEIVPEDKKARLSWTAPDMGGHNVARYEIKYAYTIDDIIDNFQLNAIEWSLGRPFPLAAGSETTFTLDMSQDPSLLDKPLYFAIKSYTNTHTDPTQTASNIVRVFVPSPLPPPTVIPPYSANGHDSGANWPFLTANGGDISSGPAVAKSANIGLELILPIVIGAIVLMVILILYCYCCVVKRRGLNGGHLKGVNSGGDKHNMQSTITIVPSSPGHGGYGQQHATVGTPEMHTIGVPTLPTPIHNPQQQHIPSHYTSYTNPQSPSIIDSDSSDKKRYSLIHPLESQLIDDLKAHHQQQQYNVSIIGNNGGGGGGNNQQATLPRQNSLQQQTLSPYNSWSASQLLHEHERRHSPNMTMDEVMAMEEQWKNGGGQQIVMMDAAGHQLILPDQYTCQPQMNPQHVPPPVPPLPLLAPSYQPTANYNQSNNGGGYAIYGTNPNHHHQPPAQLNNQQSIYQTMQRANDQTNSVPVAAPPSVNGGNNYNAPGSLQGSLTSVNSGEKKRRNVTMV